MRASALAALAACVLVLPAGCGLFKDASQKPMPLAEIRASVTPKVDGGRVVTAAADGTVTILEAESGRVLARLDAQRKLSSGPAVEGELVIVGTIKGQVIALDASGREKWVADVAGEVLAPAVPAAGRSAIVRTADGRIFSLSLADGKRQWVYTRPTPALLLRSETAVVATASNVAAGYPGGKLIALDLDDGKLTWEVTVSLPRGATELERVADVAGLPVIDGGSICAAAFQGKVACFDIQSGNTIWTRDISSASGLVIDERNAYLSDDKDNVHALDRTSGASRWKQDRLLRRKLTLPAVVDGKIVVGDSLGYLHVLSADDGALVGRLALDGSAVNALVPANGGLLVQTAGGTLSFVRF